MSSRMVTQYLIPALLAGSAAHAGTFLVTSNADSGPGSLRDAITLAEQSPGLDRIEFRLPASRAKLLLQAPLPEMFDSVQLFGRIPGGAGGMLRVELDGARAGGTALVVHGSNSLVAGFAIHGFENGIVVCDGSDSVVSDCWVGLDATGRGPTGRMVAGIQVLDSSGNLIGGRDEQRRNVVTGCDVAILIGGALGASDNVVTGNWIGFDAGGTLLGNDFGIRVDPATGGDNVIGGAQPGAGNVIAGSQVAAIDLTANSRRTRVMGNLVGTDPLGLVPLGNKTGLYGSGTDDVIGGSRKGAGNVFAGNVVGIGLYGAKGALVLGNLVGIDVALQRPLPNRIGIEADGGSRDGLLAQNLVVFSAGPGVQIAASKRMEVRSNGIVLNGDHGVLVWDSSPDAVLEGNVVAQNARSGVLLFGDRALVHANKIWGNLENGITVGTQWSGVPGVQNALRANSIHDNGLLAIDLGADAYGTGDGVTPNDMLDRDGGPNMLQNYPELGRIVASRGRTNVHGTLDSRPNAKFWLDFYSSPAPDPSGHGEAETYLGQFVVFTNAMGLASFDAWLPGASAAGDFVAATATDAWGDTSELSLAHAVVEAPVER